MQAKVRDNKLHISGYVNVPGRLSSRPVYTPKHGKVMETIEQRAFTKALDRTHDVRLLLDHLADRELASVAAGNLTLKEDRIGLRGRRSLMTRKWCKMLISCEAGLSRCSMLKIAWNRERMVYRSAMLRTLTCRKYRSFCTRIQFMLRHLSNCDQMMKQK